MAPRPPKGEVIRKPNNAGATYALRFMAYGKRRYVTLGAEGDWTEADAHQELVNVLADVRRGIWKPASRVAAAEVAPDPDFHTFASEWYEANKGEWREATRLDYEWQLRVHLLPFFAGHRLSEITVAEVDRYREAKVRESATLARAFERWRERVNAEKDAAKLRKLRRARPPQGLSPASINKTITRLGQILEVAVERELIARNAARVGGKRRKVKTTKPRRTYLDRADQIEALLAAAGELDAEQKSNGDMRRRALLATLVFSGLRISELLALDWRDVDLATGRLRVRQSKTDAGIRYVELLPALAGELRALKAERKPGPRDPVIASASGTRQERNRVRSRVLHKAIERANANLADEGLAELPEGLTLHALRRTFCSLLVALGKDPAYVMAQMGHTDPTVTLGLYAKVMSVTEGDRDRLRALAEGDYLALAGTGSDSEPSGAEGPTRTATARAPR